MDEREFQAALAGSATEPELEALIARFRYAFEKSGGDPHAAMAAVNEMLDQPLPYEEFLSRLRPDEA